MARGLLFAVDVAVGAGGFRREGQDYALGAREASRVTSAPSREPSDGVERERQKYSRPKRAKGVGNVSGGSGGHLPEFST